MSSPEKKKRKTLTQKPSLKTCGTPESTPIPLLPDDLLLSCFARVSRLYYPSPSLASKRLGSLLASPELYQVRSSLGRQETCLYVCLRFPPDPNPRWFTLCRRPNQTLTNHKKKKKPSRHALATVPISHSPPPAHGSGVVTIGSNFYNIGGCVDQSPSSSVSILDCRSHTWREGPSMRVARSRPSVNVVDGKIYVVGGCKDCDSSNWIEVFDPEMQTWELVSTPAVKICAIGTTTTIDGKIYIFGGVRRLAYEPKENSWEIATSTQWICLPPPYCVIENVVYSYTLGSLSWLDIKVRRTWTKLKGMDRFPTFARFSRVKFVEYGGKLAVLWDKIERSNGSKTKMIWCALVAVEKLNDQEIMGKLEWCDAVLRVPKSYQFDHALCATV